MNDRISSVLDQKARKVECTEVYTTVFDAVTHMNAQRIGALVVTDGERIWIDVRGLRTLELAPI